MRISDAEVKRLINAPGQSIVEAIELVGTENFRQQDQQLVKGLAKEINNRPDREDMIAELRAQIEAGEYNPSGEEIVESMLRRAIADQFGARG